MVLSYIINLQKIPAIEWENAFNGIKKIVENYPVELMRIKQENKLATQRLCWTDEVQFQDNGSDCIQLKGDMLTLEYGSTFTFYRNIEQQMLQKEEVDYSQNAFYLKPEKEYFNCITGYFGFDIFNNYDTCGYPYSYCILAIGIYLEHCFYEDSYMAGKYNPQQTELVTDWLCDLFKTEIAQPKALQQHLLWQKIEPLYPNANDAITRFWFLSIRDTALKIQFLLKQNKENTQLFLVEKIKNYNSVSQLGAIDVLIPYLTACNDLDEFILFFKEVQKVNTSESFNLAALLKMILNEGVCDKPFENEMIGEINKQRPSLETGMESLNKMFFMMAGLPNKTQFSTSPEELLEVFAYYEPQNGKTFKLLLDDNVEIIKKKRNKANQEIESAVDNVVQEMEDEVLVETKNIRRFGLVSEDYFIQEAQSQQKNYPNFERGAKIIGASIRKNLADYKAKYNEKFIDSENKNKLLKSIYEAIERRGFVLTEKAWKNIETENDMEILESIYYYVSLTEREMQFWNWRKYFLENEKYWIYLKD